MMFIFNLALLEVISESDVVMWSDHQTGAFAIQPFVNCGDLFRSCFLL